MANIEITRTEPVRPGKYDEDGNPIPPAASDCSSRSSSG
jgi:hypothetical protein